MKMKTKYLLQSAVIAAIYMVLTIVLAPLSYGPVQFRLAEALTVIPALTPAGVPGIFVGCLVANLLGPYGIIDVVLGSLASLLSALFTYKLREKPLLAPLPPVVINGVIIGAMLHYVYGVPSLLLTILWVSLGQFGACYVVGYPLLRLLKPYEGVLK